MIKLYIGLAILAIIGLGYLHYTNLLSTITELEKDNLALNLTIETKNLVIEQKKDIIRDLKLASAMQDIRTDKLNTDLQDARDDVTSVAQAFSKINLEEEADKRPEVLQRAMNIGTIRAFRKIEAVSRK